jgi:hypothetical protein
MAISDTLNETQGMTTHVRRGWPDEEIHVVRRMDAAVRNHGPTAHQQELRLCFAELDQQIREA